MSADETVVTIARRAAARLEAEQQRDDLTPHVEAALQGQQDAARSFGPEQFSMEGLADVATVAGAIVAFATLAWTVWRAVRNKTGEAPAKETVMRQVRVKASQEMNLPQGKCSREIEVVVEEAIEVAKEGR